MLLGEYIPGQPPTPNVCERRRNNKGTTSRRPSGTSSRTNDGRRRSPSAQRLEVGGRARVRVGTNLRCHHLLPIGTHGVPDADPLPGHTSRPAATRAWTDQWSRAGREPAAPCDRTFGSADSFPRRATGRLRREQGDGARHRHRSQSCVGSDRSEEGVRLSDRAACPTRARRLNWVPDSRAG
jgi:hypothetical protein